MNDYHRISRERDALAVQLAHEWGWPDGDSVLTRLRGDRTSALLTFHESTMLVALGSKHDLKVEDND